MSGEALGRRLLVLDAAYCVAAGLIAIVAFVPFADLLAAPKRATRRRRRCREPPPPSTRAGGRWRRPVAAVAAANIAATGAFAAIALSTPRLAGRLLLAAIALEVAGFAAGQLAALRRRPA